VGEPGGNRRVHDHPGRVLGSGASVVPIGDACADGSAVVELIASPTFRPFADFRYDPALPPSRDERELGVTVRDLRVR
jgi:hypothetical protein